MYFFSVVCLSFSILLSLSSISTVYQRAYSVTCPLTICSIWFLITVGPLPQWVSQCGRNRKRCTGEVRQAIWVNRYRKGLHEIKWQTSPRRGKFVTGRRRIPIELFGPIWDKKPPRIQKSQLSHPSGPYSIGNQRIWKYVRKLCSRESF